MDQQSRAYRESGPDDWTPQAELDELAAATPADARPAPRSVYDNDGWDAERQPTKTPGQAAETANARGDDGSVYLDGTG